MKFRRMGALLVAMLLGTIGAVALASPASAWNWGPFQLVHSSAYCLEAPTGNLNQQLILNYCGGPASHNQHFVFEDTNTGPWMYFVHLEGSPYCLVPGNASLFHSTIVLYTCDRSQSRFMWQLGFAETADQTKRWMQGGQQPAWCIDNLSPSAGVYVTMENCYVTDWFRLIQQ